MVTFSRKRTSGAELGQILPYCSTSIWKQKNFRSGKVIHVLTASILAVECRFGLYCPFTHSEISHALGIVYCWQRNSELCLPCLTVAQNNSSKRTTAINWIKEKCPPETSASVAFRSSLSLVSFSTDPQTKQPLQAAALCPITAVHLLQWQHKNTATKREKWPFPQLE